MWRTDSLEKTLMLGKIEGGRRVDNRGWDVCVASPTQCTWVWVNSGSWWWTGRPVVLQSMGSQRVGHDWATELNWTEPIFCSGRVNSPEHFLHLEVLDLITSAKSLLPWKVRDSQVPGSERGHLVGDTCSPRGPHLACSPIRRLIPILSLFPRLLGPGLFYPNRIKQCFPSCTQWMGSSGLSQKTTATEI